MRRASRERNDRQLGVPISRPVLLRCRGDGPERLGFRAQRSQTTGWQVLSVSESGPQECGEAVVERAQGRTAADCECVRRGVDGVGDVDDVTGQKKEIPVTKKQ